MKTYIIKQMVQLGTKPKKCIRKIKVTNQELLEKYKKEIEQELITETIEIEEYEEEE